MTVRDFIDKLIKETPDLDSDIYVLERLPEDDLECQDYKISEITSEGCNDSICIYIEKI